MSIASQVASVSQSDWNIVAAAIATFCVTAFFTARGFIKGKQKVEEGKSALTPIVGATIMESASMAQLSDRLRENTEAVRQNTHELQRCNDLTLMRSRSEKG